MRLLARSTARAALLVALASLCKPAVAEDLDLKFDYVVTINATMSGSASDENSRTVWSSRLNHTITVTKSWKNPTLGMGFVAQFAAADFQHNLSSSGTYTLSAENRSVNEAWTYERNKDQTPDGGQIAITPVMSPVYCSVGVPYRWRYKSTSTDTAYSGQGFLSDIDDAWAEVQRRMKQGYTYPESFWTFLPPKAGGKWTPPARMATYSTGAIVRETTTSREVTEVSITVRYTISLDAPTPPPAQEDTEGQCRASGSVIGCLNQSLGQELPIAGTPYKMVYRSERMPGATGSSVVWLARNRSLGWWSLDVHHTFDPESNVIFLGYGERRSGQNLNPFPALLGGYLIPDRDRQAVYEFDAQGKHLRTRNALTRVMELEFEYDKLGSLTRIKDTFGNETRLESAKGSPVSITGPYGHRTGFTTDVVGYLTSLTMPDGSRFQMSYDWSGLMTSFTDPRGGTYQFAYDGVGRLRQDTNPAGGYQILTRFEESNGFAVQRITSVGRTTLYRVGTSQEAAKQIQTEFPHGGSAQGSRNGRYLSALQDSTGFSMSADWAPDANWGAQSPVPNSMSFATPGGISAAITLDRSVELSDASDPLSVSAIHEVLSVNGNEDRSDYIAAARTLATTTAGGRRVERRFNFNGQIERIQLGSMAPVTYAYDTRGRLSSISAGEGDQKRTSRFEYGANGYLQNAIDPLGGITTLQYDDAGRVVKMTRPDGEAVMSSYDANGNKTSITPPGRPAHTAEYTAVDLQSSYTPPPVEGSGQPALTDWNSDREFERQVRPDGGIVRQILDAKGRRGSLEFPQGRIVYTYDGASAIVKKVEDTEGNAVSFERDARVLKAETWSGKVRGSIRRTYNSDFVAASYSVNDGELVALDYDRDGLLKQAGEMTISRDAESGLVSGTALAGITDTFGYNPFGELTDYRAGGPSGTLFSFHLVYDKLGRIMERTETAGGATAVYQYSFDQAGRLASVRKDGAIIASYSYDPNGNRIGLAEAAGVTSATYDDQDRMIQQGDVTYEYNAAGELTRKKFAGDETVYSPDALGNLRRVILPRGREVRYIIDPENRRIGKMTDGQMVRGFLYWGALRPIAELDGDGNVTTVFVYGGASGTPAYLIKDGIKYRIITDMLGSPRLVVNADTGEIAQRMDYDAFGKVLSDSNPGFQPFGFAGGLYDPDTGLVRFGARDYDPESGRWTSKDPLGFGSRETNLYAYAENDPVNRHDAYGMQSSALDMGSSVNSQIMPKQTEDVSKAVETVKQVVEVGKAIQEEGVKGGLNKIANDKAQQQHLPGASEEYRRNLGVTQEVEPAAWDLSGKVVSGWKTVTKALGCGDPEPPKPDPKDRQPNDWEKKTGSKPLTPADIKSKPKVNFGSKSNAFE